MDAAEELPGQRSAVLVIRLWRDGGFRARVLEWSDAPPYPQPDQQPDQHPDRRSGPASTYATATDPAAVSAIVEAWVADFLSD